MFPSSALDASSATRAIRGSSDFRCQSACMTSPLPQYVDAVKPRPQYLNIAQNTLTKKKQKTYYPHDTNDVTLRNIYNSSSSSSSSTDSSPIVPHCTMCPALLPTTYLSTAYCLLSTVYCLLSTVYCLTACRLVPPVRPRQLVVVAAQIVATRTPRAGATSVR